MAVERKGHRTANLARHTEGSLQISNGQRGTQRIGTRYVTGSQNLTALLRHTNGFSTTT